MMRKPIRLALITSVTITILLLGFVYVPKIGGRFSERTDEKMPSGITSKSLNMRETPNILSNKTLTIPTGHTVKILDESGFSETFEGITANWLKVEYNKTIGWVWGGFVSYTLENGNRDSNNKTDRYVINLKTEQQKIEKCLEQGKFKTSSYAKLYGNDKLIEYDNSNEYWDSYFDNLEATFHFVKNDKGKIVVFEYSPYSQSGDWFVVETHYFDSRGRVYIIDKYKSLFNVYDECGKDPATFRLTNYFDTDFNLIFSEKEVDCEEMEDYKMLFKIFKNTTELTNAIRI